jgi:nucleotide-binding universal stress UspA family protein
MPKKLLCATDGSDHAAKAITHAIELAKLTDAELTFIAVNHLFEVMGPAQLWEDRELARLLDDAASRATQAGLRAVKKVKAEDVDVAKAIVGYAEANEIDHIVVGPGDQSLVVQFLLGSVSKDVVRKARCTVTVVR